MVLDDFNAIMHEHMDLSDRTTRKTIISLEEADDQNQLLAALTSKLYDKIVEKVDDIDFGTIPRSRGDITKIENYESLTECIDILRNIIVEYKEDTQPIDIVSSAIENIKQRKNLFNKAYTLNVEMPIVVYNSIVLAIVSSVSYLINGCIEYIKDPGAETYTIALSKVGYVKTAQNLLFENLALFNDGCAKGDIDLAFNDIIRNNRKLSECGEGSEPNGNGVSTIVINIGDTKDDEPSDAFQGDSPLDGIEPTTNVSEDGGILAPIFWAGKALIVVAKLIIPILQNLVYFFYQSKQNISDYFAVQSELIQMNAYKVQYSTDIESNQRKVIYLKQMKIADRLKKVSNAFAIDYNKSKAGAETLAKQEKKKFKTEELGIAPMPATQSSLF